MLYDLNNTKKLENAYLDKAIFLLAIGPSLATLDLSQLKNKYTCGMKLVPVKYFMPTFWVVLEEDRATMPEEIWENKRLIKITSEEVFNKGYLQWLPPEKRIQRFESINRLSNMYYFKLHETFKASTYFTEEGISWGLASEKRDEFGVKGRRSIFLVFFKLFYYLGFRKIYLCGVDFSMSVQQPYAYNKSKPEHAVALNNTLYETLSQRLAALLPYFQERGLQVFNCNPNSNLKVFPYKSYEECLLESECV